MVLDPIPQILPVQFFGSRPQPPTSPGDTTICWCLIGISNTIFADILQYLLILYQSYTGIQTRRHFINHMQEIQTQFWLMFFDHVQEIQQQ